MFWEKLKREWKTFAWALASILVECWDQILCSELGMVDPLVSQEHQWIVHMAIPCGFLILRKWRDTMAREEASE